MWILNSRSRFVSTRDGTVRWTWFTISKDFGWCLGRGHSFVGNLVSCFVGRLLVQRWAGKLPRDSNPVPTLRPDVEWIDPESGSHGVFGGAYFAFNLEYISHCTVPIVTV